MNLHKFDLIVIGSGPGGQRAALQGAKAGKKVAIIEQSEAVGGGCLYVGTIPSKSFRESVYRWSLGSRGILGQEKDSALRASKLLLPDMQRLLKRRDRVVSSESQIIFDQLKRNNITVFHGKAQVTSPTSVEVVSGKKVVQLSCQFIIVAVGATPIGPRHLIVDGKYVHDSNTILSLKKLPKRLAVLGAGVIGCEYASMFSMAGTKVFLVDKRPEILASVDREIVNHLVQRFVSLGMEMVLSAETTRLEIKKGTKGKSGSGVKVHLSQSLAQPLAQKATQKPPLDRKLDVDVILIAAGRKGNTDGLGLKEAGVLLDERGLVKVDSNFKTAVHTIYAVGDVIGAPALAATSMEQGRIATCRAFNIDDSSMPLLFPYGIYTIPEISMVGLTEEELLAQKVEFVAGRARYRELARGQIVGDKWGLLKILVDKKTLKLHGIHIMGDNAADLIHIGQAVMDFGGDVNYFIRTVFNYPTLAEAYKTAAFHAVNQIKGTTRTK
jgi:NAD(P) transhydrogenase